jgi:enoyl-[acyl-carrier-protein] reductase (NADH)
VLEQWRADTSHGAATPRVVVAVWPIDHASEALVDASASEFARRAEWPFAAWYAALGAAAARCAEGGVVVAVVERPSPLDCAGWAPESGMADAVEALVRSLARSEGPRGVRVNAVTTPTRLAPARPIAPPPPLAVFPGRVDVEVAAAVAMLLGQGVAGVTGTIVHADCGRSWR